MLHVVIIESIGRNWAEYIKFLDMKIDVIVSLSRASSALRERGMDRSRVSCDNRRTRKTAQLGAFRKYSGWDGQSSDI